MRVEQVKEGARSALRAAYDDPRYRPFQLRTDRIEANLERVRTEVEAERQAHLRPEGVRARPLPVYQEPAPVRMTQAQVLREEALYRRKLEAQYALIRSYETELRDTSEFDSWQARMQDADALARLQRIEEVRLDAVLASKNAVEARHVASMQNRVAALKLQQDQQRALDREARAREAELADRQALAQEVATDTKLKPREAKARVVAARRDNAESLARERRENELRLAEEFELDRQRKEDLIRQIRYGLRRCRVATGCRSRRVRVEPWKLCRAPCRRPSTPQRRLATACWTRCRSRS